MDCAVAVVAIPNWNWLVHRNIEKCTRTHALLYVIVERSYQAARDNEVVDGADRRSACAWFLLAYIKLTRPTLEKLFFDARIWVVDHALGLTHSHSTFTRCSQRRRRAPENRREQSAAVGTTSPTDILPCTSHGGIYFLHQWDFSLSLFLYSTPVLLSSLLLPYSFCFQPIFYRLRSYSSQSAAAAAAAPVGERCFGNASLRSLSTRIKGGGWNPCYDPGGECMENTHRQAQFRNDVLLSVLTVNAVKKKNMLRQVLQFLDVTGRKRVRATKRKIK